MTRLKITWRNEASLETGELRPEGGAHDASLDVFYTEGIPAAQGGSIAEQPNRALHPSAAGSGAEAAAGER
jgi:hypothetical protein